MRKSLDPQTEHTARLFAQQVSKKYSAVEVIVFGSRARQTHQPDSDLDIAILLNGEQLPFIKTKLEMADLAFDLMLETGLLVQPLPIWTQEWQHPENYSNPALLNNIAREGFRL